MPSDINQRLGFEAGGAIKVLRNLAKALGTAATAMNAFSKSARNFNGSTSGFDTALKNLSTQITNTTTKLKTLTDTLGKMPAAVTKVSKPTNKFVQSLKSLASMAIRVLIIQNVTRVIRSFVQGVLRGIEAARQYGLALAEIETISSQSLGSTVELSNAIMQLSVEFGRSAKAVAEGLYQTISNQVKGAANAFDLLSTAMKLATITAAAPKDAISAISSVLNSYSLNVSHAAEVSDILFKTVELGRLRLSEIGDIIGRVTPLSAKLGISFKETAAAIAVMTRQGVKANTAVTQLRAVEQKLIKPTEKMVELFHKWGVEDGATAIKTFGGLTGVLKKMAVETGHNDAEMAALFSRVRAIVGEMSLMTDEGKLMTDTLKEMGDAIGVVNKTWLKFKSTDAQQLTSATEELNNAYIKAGTSLQRWLTIWTKVKTFALNALILMTGSLDRFTIDLIDAIAEIDRKLKESKDTAHENNPIPTVADLNERLQGARKVLAEWQADHIKLYDTIEDRLDVFASGARTRLKGIFTGLKNQLQPLSDFVENFKQQTAELEASTAALRTERDIRKAAKRGPEAEIRTRTSIAEKQIAEGLKLLRENMDANSIKAGRRLLDLGQKGLEQAAQLAKKEKSTKAAGIERKITNLYDKRIKAQDELNARRADSYDDAAKADKSAKDQLADKTKLIQQYSNTLKQLAKALDPAEALDLEAKLSDLETQIKEFSFKGIDESLLRALNIDLTASQFSTSLSDAVDEIRFDWDSKMQKAGDSLFTHLQAAADKLDLTTELAKQIEEGSLDVGKGPAGISNYDKINKNEKQRLEFARERRDIEKDSLAEQVKLSLALTTLQKQRDVERAPPIQAGMFGLSAAATPEVGKELDYSSTLKLLESLKEATPGRALEAVMVKVQEFHAILLDGGVLTQEQMKEMADVATAAKEVTADAMDSAINITIASVRRMQEQNLKMEAITKDSKNQGIEETGVAFEKAAEKSAELTEEAKEAAQAIKEAATATGSAATKTTRWNTETKGVKTAVDVIPGALTTIGNGIVANTVKMNKLRDAAIAAAKAIAAAAASGGGKPAYFGGVQHLASGGLGQDTVSAMLTPGEFVVNKASTSKFFSELSAINGGSKPIYREQGGDVTTVGDINVTVNGGDSSQATVREIGYALKREMRRGTLKL